MVSTIFDELMSIIKKGRLLLLLITSCLLVACSNNGCEETREAYCTAELRGVTGASLTSLSIWGIGQGGATDKTDSLMYEGAPSEHISLMLNPDTTATRLRLLFTGVVDRERVQIADTITLLYDVSPYFLNMECGCSVFFTLKELITTHNFIYEAGITRKEITNEEAINFVLDY